MLTRDPGRGRYVVDFANMNRTVEEPPNLYGRNAVDTHEGAGGGSENGKFAWESSVAMPLTEEDENEECSDDDDDDDETPQKSKGGEKSVRVRVDTYTSDDVFEESSSPSQSSPTSEKPPSGAGGASDDSMV